LGCGGTTTRRITKQPSVDLGNPKEEITQRTQQNLGELGAFFLQPPRDADVEEATDFLVWVEREREKETS
jgi:hypothetical protein